MEVDEHGLRSPLRSTTGYFCPYSNIVAHSARTRTFGSRIFSPQQESVEIHEVAHWQIFQTTSVGLLIQFLHQLRFNAVNFCFNYGSKSRPIIGLRGEKIALPLKETMSSEFWRNRFWISHDVEELLFKIDRTDFVGKKIAFSSEEDIQSDVLFHLNTILQSANRTERVGPEDGEFSFACYKHLYDVEEQRIALMFSNDHVNTEWLMESYSSILELVTLYKYRSYDSMLELYSLFIASKYALPVLFFFKDLSITLSCTELIQLSPIILMIIEISLDPPVPPKYELSISNMRWNDIYPPARYWALVKLIRESGIVLLKDIRLDSINRFTLNRFPETISMASREQRKINSQFRQGNYSKFAEKFQTFATSGHADFLMPLFGDLHIYSFLMIAKAMRQSGYTSLTEFNLVDPDYRSPVRTTASKYLTRPPIMLSNQGRVMFNANWSNEYCKMLLETAMMEFCQDDYAVNSVDVRAFSFSSKLNETSTWEWCDDFEKIINEEIMPHQHLDLFRDLS